MFPVKIYSFSSPVFGIPPPPPKAMPPQAPRTALGPTAAAVALTVRAFPPSGPAEKPELEARGCAVLGKESNRDRSLKVMRFRPKPQVHRRHCNDNKMWYIPSESP